MTAEVVDEGDFPHAPSAPPPQKTAAMEEEILALGKWTFNLGGVVEDFRDVLKRFQESLKHWSDHEPEPESPIRELSELVSQAAREGARQATIDIGIYNEGGGSDSKWNKRTLSALVVLALAIALGGVIVMWTVEQRLERIELRLANIEQKALL